jgi:hypothetical protein
MLLTRREFFKISVRALAGVALATSDTVFVFPSHAHHSPQHSGYRDADSLMMLGTGSQGTERLWDGEQMEAGIHMRWFFETSEGFPDSGFEVFRRVSGQRTVVSFTELAARLQRAPSASLSLGAVTFSSNLNLLATADLSELDVRTKEIVQLKFQPLIWHFRLGLTPAPGKVLFIAGSGGTTQFTRTAVKSTRIFQCSAPVNQIEISGEGRITSLEFDTRDPESGWQSVTRLCLPITDLQYPCRHKNANGTVDGDEKEAKARLPQTLSIVNRYISGGGPSTIRPFRDELRPELMALGTHRPYPTWMGKTGDPVLKGINHEDPLLLFSLNPYIARILGLYYVDSEIAGTRASFDYKVEGKWLAGQLRFWEMPDIHGPQRRSHNGFTLTSTMQAQVQRDYELLIFSGSSFFVELVFPSIGIWQATLVAATAASPVHGNGKFNIEATFAGGRMERRSMPRSLESVAFKGRHITKLRITGSGILLLSRLEYRHQTGQEARSARAYDYQLSIEDTRHVASTPEGLNAWELKGWGAAPRTDGDEASANAVGLHWINDSNVDESGEIFDSPAMPLSAIEWHDFKLASSEASPPQLSGNEKFTLLNDGNPVLTTATAQSAGFPQGSSSEEAEGRRLGSLEFLITGQPPKNRANPQPPVNFLRYVHTRLKDGWYGYRIRSVDFFGRTSAPSTVSAVRLANRRLPRPPILLEARYLQQNDPKRLRTIDEDAWLISNPSKNGLRVRWAWLPSHYHDSPKALTFKIYGPTIRPQSVSIGDPAQELSGTIAEEKKGAAGQIIEVLHIKGAVTAVEDVGNLVCRLTTDATIEERHVNLFSQAHLLQGTGQHQILEHTGGSNIVFLVKRPVNVACPSTGPFILDHSLLKTSLVLHQHNELLVEGLLDANGVQSHVVALVGRSYFLVRHHTATPTVSPGIGDFSLSPFTGEAGLQAMIKSVFEDPNTRTSKLNVQLGQSMRALQVNMLVGGVIETGIGTYTILENAATDTKTKTALITVREHDDPANLRPKPGNCIIKMPILTTLHADHVLSGMLISPRKMGGFIKTSEQQFIVLGVWKKSNSAFPSMEHTCFLVTYVPSATVPPSIGSPFVYFPSYEEIVETSAGISNAEIISTPVSFSATIKSVHIELHSITLVTDRDVAGDRETFNSGNLQSQGHAYKVTKAIALAPLTLVIESPAASVPLPTINSSCTVSGKMPGIVVVPTDKAGTGWRWFAGGMLDQEAKPFQVVGSTINDDLIVLKQTDGSVPVTGPIAYRSVSSQQPVNHGLVSVTAVDPHGESSPSTSFAVSSIYRAQLPTPVLGPIPPASGCLLAELADWYGLSSFVLSWAATPDEMFQVYRTMDGLLYERDLATRERGPRKWTGGTDSLTTADLPPRLQTDPHEPQIRAAIQVDFNDLDSYIESWKSAPSNEKPQRLHEIEERYKKLRNDSHEILASQDHVVEAFALLTRQPLMPNEGIVQFRDQLPGQSSNRFFYRIRAVDIAGNISMLSTSTPPVCTPYLPPPRRPVLVEAAGGANAISLLWIGSSEANVTEYLLYRSESEEFAKDIRFMTLHRRITSGPSITPKPGEVVPTEAVGVIHGLQLQDSVKANITYHYRLVALDMNGNVSEASSAVAARAYQPPPSPPAWKSAIRMPFGAPTGIRLIWEHPTEPGLRTLVERRKANGTLWVAASTWLPAGHYTFDDSPPDLHEEWHYRLRVLDDLGQTAVSLPNITIFAEP